MWDQMISSFGKPDMFRVISFQVDELGFPLLAEGGIIRFVL